MSHPIEFQALSWHAEDIDFNDVDDNDMFSESSSSDGGHKRIVQDSLFYIVKVFGRTTSGQSASVTVTGFRPYFYIQVGDSWTRESVRSFIDDTLIKDMGQRAFLNLDRDETTIVERKDMWGFTNGKVGKFLKFSFKSCKFMKFAAKFFITRDVKDKRYRVYESNMDPYLRFFHIRGIKPCAWLNVFSSTPATILPTTSAIDRQTHYSNVHEAKVPLDRQDAPFRVMSFDIECMSLTGEFPVAKRDYSRLATVVFDGIKRWSDGTTYDIVTRSTHLIARILGASDAPSLTKLDPASQREVEIAATYSAKDVFEHRPDSNALVSIIKTVIDEIIAVYKSPPPAPPLPKVLDKKTGKLVDATVTPEEVVRSSRERAIAKMTDRLNLYFPKLRGDPVIQIGATVHNYGDRNVSIRKIVTLGTCGAIPKPADGVETVVQQCKTEYDVLIRFAEIVREVDPDIVTGYNIFGFDMLYIDKRANELGCKMQLMTIVNRLVARQAEFKTQLLTSSSLGDNYLHYFDMPGRVSIDLMKVVQRDHKLDSYKLDDVAQTFTGMKKHDVSPQEIFRLQKGSSEDRRKIAEYCVQDCELVNRLIMKLEVLANNMGMSNVCSVPLAFIFMRGQGIKIFSLVLSQSHQDGFVIPVLVTEDKENKTATNEGDSYEGATVLQPECDIYMDDPVSVLDYASLYPSSMISENLSHDTIVLDDKYANLPGLKYREIEYDIIDANKKKLQKKTCRFVDRGSYEGLLPRTLNQLLSARKKTRARINDVKVVYDDGSSEVVSKEISKSHEINGKSIVKREDAYNEFQRAVLDGLQNAYKVTANSLYGQMGYPKGQMFMKDIAACTTATGRTMIYKAKDFLEKEYNARVVYGDTDSIFCVFPNEDKGHAAIKRSIALAHSASKEFTKHIDRPHDLEYDKTFWPFILLSKKRYVGNLYEDSDEKYVQKSMGIVLKRRDNAPIVKDVYSGVIDMILNKNDIRGSVSFLKHELQKLADGDCALEQLIVSKTLKDKYSSPMHIAHKVLADRMAERDPGTRPQVGDRIPYVYVVVKEDKKKMLQGNRIEHPDFIRANALSPDYHFYITNQIMKPVLQIYGLIVERLEGYRRPAGHFEFMATKLSEKEKDPQKVADKIVALRETCAGEILFEPTLGALECRNSGNRDISSFFARREF